MTINEVIGYICVIVGCGAISYAFMKFVEYIDNPKRNSHKD